MLWELACTLAAVFLFVSPVDQMRERAVGMSLLSRVCVSIILALAHEIENDL